MDSPVHPPEQQRRLPACTPYKALNHHKRGCYVQPPQQGGEAIISVFPENPISGKFPGTHVSRQNLEEALILRAPTWPLCGDTPEEAGCENSRRPATEAIRRRFWQPNPRARKGALLLDIDRKGGVNPLDGPIPTLTTFNTLSEHQQVDYLLLNPIPYGGRSRRAPQQFLEDVLAGLVYAHDADRNYTGLLARGPLHPDHITRVMSGRIYTLAELAQDLPPLKKVITTQQELRKLAELVEIESRNCETFEMLRHVGYRIAREGHLGEALRRRLQDQADQVNRTAWADHPSGPLSASELRGIVGSIVRYINSHHDPNKASRSPRASIHSRDRGGALPEAEQLANRRAGQAQGAESRREATRAAIVNAVGQLVAKGERVTRQKLADITGVPERTLSRHADLWNR